MSQYSTFARRTALWPSGRLLCKISGWLLVGSDLRADRQHSPPWNLRPRHKSGRLGDPTLPTTTKAGSAQKDAKITKIQIGKRSAKSSYHQRLLSVFREPDLPLNLKTENRFNRRLQLQQVTIIDAAKVLPRKDRMLMPQNLLKICEIGGICGFNFRIWAQRRPLPPPKEATFSRHSPRKSVARYSNSGGVFVLVVPLSCGAES